MRFNKQMAWLVLGCLGLGMFLAADKPKDPAVERARREVKMLDDLYKTAVVAITEHYVQDESSIAAATAAKILFKSMKEKGWHDVRLIDATGKPYEEGNLPKDGFEKEAIAKLKGGASYHEQIVDLGGGKRELKAATIVPVVMEKCVMCHSHYKDAKKGEAIGALIYSLPIE